jgi:hypothetical protein
MHPGMKVQKAASKLVYHWGADIRRLPDFIPRANKLLSSIQHICLAFFPAMPFQDDKFGDYIAKNY